MLKAANKLTQLWGWLRGRRTRTLLYHSIADSPADPFTVPPNVFREQMRWIAGSGLRVIAHAELVRAIRSGRDLPRTVVLTFDDGFCDFYDTAIPILREFGFTATVFVPSGLIGQAGRWGQEAPARDLMSETQLAAANDMGFEIGSHTVNHLSLTGARNDVVTRELIDSLAYVRALTGRREVTIAYPYGRSGERERLLATTAGYASAYLAGGLWGNGRGSDLFALVRDPIGRSTSLTGFARLVKGWSDFNRLWDDIRGGIYKSQQP